MRTPTRVQKSSSVLPTVLPAIRRCHTAPDRDAAPCPALLPLTGYSLAW